MNKNNENQKIISSEDYYGVDTYNKNGYIKNSLNPKPPTSPRPKVAGSKQK